MSEDNSALSDRDAPSDEHSTKATLVQCVRCIDSDDDVVHIFSTIARLRNFLETDRRTHVIYDYVIDCPERMEKPTQ